MLQIWFVSPSSMAGVTRKVVDPTPVVKREMERHGCTMVLQGLTVSVRAPSMAAHLHPHRQIASLHQRGPHGLQIGIPLVDSARL